MTDMAPTPTTTREFAEAIRTLERTGSTEELIDLYSPECELGNVVTGEAFHGHDGVRSFWREYTEQLGDAESSFTVMSADSEGAVLEWATELRGAVGTGRYRGATVLEFDGGKIARSMAYFDPSRLGRELERIHEPGGTGPSTRSNGDRPNSHGDGDEPDTSEASTEASTESGTRAGTDTARRPDWSGPSRPGSSPTVEG